MNKPLLFLIFSFSLTFVQAQKAIFLHHSTGAGVYNEGNVASLISTYNTNHSTSYTIDEIYYPDAPYDWKNYPFDYWYLWVNGSCDAEQAGIECLESILSRYDVVVFKHCFPGASINEDPTNPKVDMEYQSLAVYKLQYRALRAKFDQYPNKKFVVWTLAPLHRNATDATTAARAREFVNWVKNEWLTEDGQSHPNIYIFDFFNIVAESNANPTNGQLNCLKYDYEGSHDGDDSHPNTAANVVAGEQFTNFMIYVFQSSASAIKKNKTESSNPFRYVASQQVVSFNLNDVNKGNISVYDLTGRCMLIANFQGQSGQVDLSNFRKGVYFVQLTVSGGTKYVQKILISQ